MASRSRTQSIRDQAQRDPALTSRPSYFGPALTSRSSFIHPARTSRSSFVAILLAAVILPGCIQLGQTCHHAVTFTPTTLLSTPDFSDTSNINAADLDGDGRLEVLAALPEHGNLTILHNCPEACRPEVLGAAPLTAPLRANAADMDHDGHIDIVLADIGILPPSDELVGKVVLLRAVPGGWEPHVLLQDVGRVTCAEPADLDGDGDLDIVACIFGNTDGSMEWLEQRPVFTGGTGRAPGPNDSGPAFVRHRIDARPGSIVGIPVDIDGDGDLDIAQSIAQNTEEVNLWINDGHGSFQPQNLLRGENSYYGMSGIQVVDVDGDGRLDILAAHGDVYDNDLPFGLDPRTAHGVHWLHNTAKGWVPEEILQDWGVYGMAALDFDGDGDLDLALSFFQMRGMFPGMRAPSMVWMENDGHEHFTRHNVTNLPAQLVTLKVADLDHDGKQDLLVGSHVPDMTMHYGIPASMVTYSAGPCRTDLPPDAPFIQPPPPQMGGDDT